MASKWYSCPRMSNKQKLNDLVLRLLTNDDCSTGILAVFDVLRMILPAVWRSVGCGKRTVSRRREPRTVAGVAAAEEWRTVSKRSFLLSGQDK